MPITNKFKHLIESLEDNYLGKPVPVQYQKKYGVKYNKKDVIDMGFAIAKKNNIKIEGGKI